MKYWRWTPLCKGDMGTLVIALCVFPREPEFLVSGTQLSSPSLPSSSNHPPRSSSGAGSSLNPSPASWTALLASHVYHFLPHRSFTRTACFLILHADSELPNVPVIYSLVCDYVPDSPVLTNEDLYLPLHCSSECGSGTSLEIVCHVR